MLRLQAAEFGAQSGSLLLHLVNLKPVFSVMLLRLVTVFVVFQLTLKAAVGTLQLGQLEDRDVQKTLISLCTESYCLNVRVAFCV